MIDRCGTRHDSPNTIATQKKKLSHHTPGKWRECFNGAGAERRRAVHVRAGLERVGWDDGCSEAEGNVGLEGWFRDRGGGIALRCSY